MANNTDSPLTAVTVSDETNPKESNTPEPDTILSKSARKKAAKAERYAAYKLERRAREKEARKEKKRIRAEKRAAGELDEDNDERSPQPKKVKLEFGGRVAIDLGFDDKMMDKEITSLCSQLAYTYSANRSASYPFSLLFTSLNGRTLHRLESMNNAGFRRWIGTEWWTEGYEQLWLRRPSSEVQEQKAFEEATPHLTVADESEDIEAPSLQRPLASETQSPAKAAQDNVVYLTADSEQELLELKPDETYIIGGICDHNRYKNLCFNKAKESGIRTARLPIGRYLASFPTRKVLTVNQVFEIMVKWVETKSWEEALYSVMPKRKFQTGKKEAINIDEDSDAQELEVMRNESEGTQEATEGRNNG